MSVPNEVIVVPPELGALVADREKVWADIDKSQGLSAELTKLSSQVPERAPAELQLQFGPESTPPAELAAILPLLKEKIDTARKLGADVKACHDEIAAIKQREKMTVVAMVVGAVVLFIVLLLVIASLISGS
jgi:hypothetical protein